VRVAFSYIETFWPHARARGAEDRYGCVRLLADLPLGLGSVRAYAQAVPGLAGRCVMENRVFTDGVRGPAAAAALLRTRPDVAAFGCYLWNLNAVLRACKALKARQPGVRVVLGGPEVPRDPARLRDFLRGHSFVDCAIPGEGEVPFAGLLEAWLDGTAAESVPGLALRRGNSALWTGAAREVSDLGALPSPYLSGAVSVRPGAVGMVCLETSRGCAGACVYCDYHAGRHTVRTFALDRLRGEVSALRRAGFAGTVYLTDPTLNADQDRARRVLEVFRDWNGVLYLELSPEFLDPGTVAALGRVPRVMLALGIQSTHAPTLRSVGRPLDLERSARNIRSLIAHPNVRVELELILGLPGDDYDSFRESVGWALRFSPAAQITFFDLVVLPNAPLARMLDRFGIETDPEGLVRSTRSFSAGDLVRASRLAAAYCRLRSEPERWAAFAAAAGSGGSPPALLEAEAARLLAEGALPEGRLVGQGGRRLPGRPQRAKRWFDVAGGERDVGAEGRWW